MGKKGRERVEGRKGGKWKKGERSKKGGEVRGRGTKGSGWKREMQGKEGKGKGRKR